MLHSYMAECPQLILHHALQEFYFNLLTNLVVEYEDKCASLKIRKRLGIAALNYLLKENGLNATDLSCLFEVAQSFGYENSL